MTIILWLVLTVYGFLLLNKFFLWITSSHPEKQKVSSLDLKKGALQKFIWEFYREHFRSVYLCQIVFAIAYYLLGTAIFSYSGYLQIPLWILLFIAVKMNYIFSSRICFHLLDEVPSKPFNYSISWDTIYSIGVFFTGIGIRPVLWGLLLIALPILSVSFAEQAAFSLLLVPVGCIVVPCVALRTFYRYFMTPLILMDNKKMTLCSAKYLSLIYSQDAKKMILQIVIKKLVLIVLLFIFIAFGRQGLLDLDLKAYYILFMILSNFLIAFCMSYIFVSIALLYRIVSSDEFQGDDNDLMEKAFDSIMSKPEET